MVIQAYVGRHPPQMSTFIPPSFSPAEIELEFRNEGNANVVFRISPAAPRTTQNESLKVKQAGLETILSPKTVKELGLYPDGEDHPITLDALLEPDWRHSNKPEQQRAYNRETAAKLAKFLARHVQNGQAELGQAKEASLAAMEVVGLLTFPHRPTLLRLKKKMPFYENSHSTYDFYMNTIRDYIPARHLVHQHLIKLNPELIEKCNAEIRCLESQGKRPSNRLGTYIHPTDAALIIRDMTSYNEEQSVTLEFKPKWLWQSPTAPRDARRCRTCALRAQRSSSKAAKSKGNNTNVSLNGSHKGIQSRTDRRAICPLALATGDERLVRQALELLVDNKDSYIGHEPAWLSSLPGKGGPNTAKPVNQDDTLSTAHARRPQPRTREALIEHLYNHFKMGGEGHRVLEGLQNLQRALDPTGILYNEPSEEFLLAMTLRDCSLYVQVHWSEAGDRRIESRLGDLDPKVARGGKLEQWRETERRLVSEGWYHGEDRTCLLSRHRAPPPAVQALRR